MRAASKSVGIGFLSDVQRMNVALTRAKHFLFVITRCRTILVNPYWRDFVAFARTQQAILRVVLRRPNQSIVVDNKRRNGKKKIGHHSCTSLDQVFPNLRFIKPIHYGAVRNNPRMVQIDFGMSTKGDVNGKEDDGNISA